VICFVCLAASFLNAVNRVERECFDSYKIVYIFNAPYRLTRFSPYAWFQKSETKVFLMIKATVAALSLGRRGLFNVWEPDASILAVLSYLSFIVALIECHAGATIFPLARICGHPHGWESPRTQKLCHLVNTDAFSHGGHCYSVTPSGSGTDRGRIGS
jgi:hypothetical protein